MARPSLRVRFEPSGVTLVLLAGERLLDAADEHAGAALLPLACRAGNCGACLVQVRAGAAQLSPASAAERAALGELCARADERLGCQVHAREDPSIEAHAPSVVLGLVTR